MGVATCTLAELQRQEYESRIRDLENAYSQQQANLEWKAQCYNALQQSCGSGGSGGGASGGSGGGGYVNRYPPMSAFCNSAFNESAICQSSINNASFSEGLRPQAQEFDEVEEVVKLPIIKKYRVKKNLKYYLRRANIINKFPRVLRWAIYIGIINLWWQFVSNAQSIAVFLFNLLIK